MLNYAFSKKFNFYISRFMATLLLTKGSSNRNGIKKKTLAQQVTIGANTLVIVIISMICLVSVSYLISSNRSAARGYILKELQEEEKQLLQIANYWSLKISKSRSLKAISASPMQRNMRPAGDVVYVKGDTAVALLR